MHPLLPYGIMATMSLIAGFLCMLLPETRFKPTLENIDHNNQDGCTVAEEKEDDDLFPETDEKKAFFSNTECYLSTA